MIVNQIICKHCGDTFDTRGKYDAHYRSKHQNKIRTNDEKDEKIYMERSKDSKFTCKCGKKFVKGATLIYHQKHCDIWIEEEISDSEYDNSIFHFYV